MTSTRLTIQIGGREALPVRAIPFVTGWDFSPDSVAADFARRSGVFARLKSVPTYHLVSGLPAPILPKEWKRIVVDMQALEAELRGQFADNRIGYQAWQRRSPTVLPAGVFVWRDEFEHEYRDKLGREWERLGDGRPDDDEISYSPMLPDDVRVLVLEGFDESISENSSSLPQRRRQAASPPPEVLYTLEEGARVLADKTGERYEHLLARLMAAALAGELPVYEPGKRLRYTYGPSGSSRVVREFYEEAYWSDITAWLQKSEPRVHVPPSARQTPQPAPRPVNSNDLAWGHSARVIAAKIHKRNPRLSNDQIAAKVRDEMSRRHTAGEPGMTGRGGRLPASTTIKRHALTGIKS